MALVTTKYKSKIRVKYRNSFLLSGAGESNSANYSLEDIILFAIKSSKCEELYIKRLEETHFSIKLCRPVPKTSV